ncbi:uncharacterized protein LOC108907252 [Anoplophora glabripennis]|uniref:uncharacterized protein LOC108907252 n=1 Tax=Anoplophora glabripennis TaxID=217634 RepID=UPI000873F1A3|nr:uncharacterized protein LOC108907252 [Anoplophora glabripennis]
MEHNDLDVDMAQLEINEKKRNFTGVFKYKLTEDNSPISSPESNETITQPRRSGRKKIRSQETEKRRVLTKPKKLLSNNSNTNEINNYYLDKRVKRLPPSLETIFEEPKGNSFMSTRKFKRCIQFSSQVAPCRNKLKVKKRSMKAQKVSIIKRLNKNVALELLKEKLSAIEEDEEINS